MSAAPDDAKERIRQTIDIVDLVGRHIELHPRGRLHVGLCPFHADTKPSLQVNQQRQTWKCWVCDKGGDIFSFTMEREGVDFREALKMLAEMAGIELHANPHRPSPPPGSPDDKPTLYRAMNWAAEQFHQCLLDPKHGAVGRDYLLEREISMDSIEKFKIGFAPNEWQWIIDRGRQQFSPEVLQAIGVVLKSQKSGRWFDRFRGRVMFPIHDTQGRPIACGGRILPQLADDKAAKYINSPETRLFSKSEQLYGLDIARNQLSQQREVIVMEGYTDVVIAHQFGLDRAVAVLGTALGERHVRLLRRFADRITLLLDGDAAGQRRASEILELFIANQVDLRIVTLPNNMDPCDYLLDNGLDAMHQLVAQAPDVWEFKLESELSGIDLLNDTHRANTALENLLSTLAKAPVGGIERGSQRLREHQILNRLSRQFRLEQDALVRRLTELRAKQANRFQRTESYQDASYQDSSYADGPPPDFDPSYDIPMDANETHAPNSSSDAHRSKIQQIMSPFERELLELLLLLPSQVEMVLERVGEAGLHSPISQRVVSYFQQQLDRDEDPSFEQLLTSIDDPSLKSLLVGIDEDAQRKAPADPQFALNELLQTYDRRNIEAELKQQQAELESRQLSDEEELNALINLVQKKQEIDC